MIKILLQTDSDYVYTFLRIIAGIIVFPYGMQKLFGWFGAPGFGPAGINVVTRFRCPVFKMLRRKEKFW